MSKLNVGYNDIVGSAVQILTVKWHDKNIKHSELVEEAKKTLGYLGFEQSSCDAWENLLDRVVHRYETDYGVQSFVRCVTLEKNANDREWFTKLKATGEVETRYFDRYKAYLRTQGFPVDGIKHDVEEILSHCANPRNVNLIEKRRGLVVGDVQSGKTANYLALINLAIDYGYKIVIVLAGIPEDLRQQTQERLDEGVIGAYSETIGNVVKYCGVGINNYYGIPLTNRENDYGKFVNDNINAQLRDYKKPVFLVVKKNAKILSTVLERLGNEVKGYESSSILIIDDEADNASISTSKPEEDPTTINGVIRKIFNKFPIASYVGFTATPFANIFINSDDDDLDNLELFPADFICRLESPGTYFGLKKVFGTDNEESHSIRILDSSERNFFPEKHDKYLQFAELAESLKEAIRTFIIGNVIRTFRGQGKAHRSMMINISRFNAPQSEIREVVEEYITKLKNIIEQEKYKKTEDFIRNTEMKALYVLFNDEFFDAAREGNIGQEILPVAWDNIKEGLYDEVKQIKVTLVNESKKNRFKYGEYKDVGARVIIVGGYILSRGLTIEGLMVSYYSRNSCAYDTLLQMGRWFGYRRGYEDLCRVYMTEKNVKCFRTVASAVDDLDQQFRQMKTEGKTPSDFGLMVKESPDTLETRALLVTARNKMRNSATKYIVLDYSGESSDTSKIKLDAQINQHNIEEFLLFKNKVGLDVAKSLVQGKLYFTDVRKSDIADFISNLKVHYLNKKFDTAILSEHIRNNSHFEKWDVLIDTGYSANNKLMAMLGFDGYRAPLRGFNISDDYEIVEAGKNNNTIINPTSFNIGLDLTKEQVQEILNRKNELNPGKIYTGLSARDYLERRERPMLIVYPLDLKNEETENNKKNWSTYDAYNKHVKGVFGEDVPVMAFAIGFPGSKSGKSLVEYRMNQIKVNQLEKMLGEEDNEGEQYE